MSLEGKEHLTASSGCFEDCCQINVASVLVHFSIEVKHVSTRAGLIPSQEPLARQNLRAPPGLCSAM